MHGQRLPLLKPPARAGRRQAKAAEALRRRPLPRTRVAPPARRPDAAWVAADRSQAPLAVMKRTKRARVAIGMRYHIPNPPLLFASSNTQLTLCTFGALASWSRGRRWTKRSAVRRLPLQRVPIVR